MGAQKKQESSKILQADSLRVYFYSSLEKLNGRSLTPVPPQTLSYSSEVLERYSMSEQFFDSVNGKMQQKILGTRMLEAQSKSFGEKKRQFREVGDLSLLLSGYFAQSIEKGLVDPSYYRKLGQSAYWQLSEMLSGQSEDNDLFAVLADCFETLSYLLNALADEDKSEPERQFFFVSEKDENEASESELLVRGIFPGDSNKH